MRIVVMCCYILSYGQVHAQCNNVCFQSFDGYCDDGGPGFEYANCRFGTDCYDCGARGSIQLAPPPPLPGGLIDTSGFCDLVSPLPSQCECAETNSNTGFVIDCAQDVPTGVQTTTLNIKIEFQPCDCSAPFAEFSWSIGSGNLNFGDGVKVAAGHTTPIAIPGISTFIPGIGNAGGIANLGVQGTRDSLDITLSFDVCVG